jgi:hypothetical protein
MSKHTPGPWRITLHGGNPDGSYRIESADGVPVARIFGASFEEHKYLDACVTAAAPELLEALKTAYELIPDKSLEEPGAATLAANLAYIKSVINKAEGHNE